MENTNRLNVLFGINKRAQTESVITRPNRLSQFGIKSRKNRLSSFGTLMKKKEAGRIQGYMNEKPLPNPFVDFVKRMGYGATTQMAGGFAGEFPFMIGHQLKTRSPSAMILKALTFPIPGMGMIPLPGQDKNVWDKVFAARDNWLDKPFADFGDLYGEKLMRKGLENLGNLHQFANKYFPRDPRIYSAGWKHPVRKVFGMVGEATPAFAMALGVGRLTGKFFPAFGNKVFASLKTPEFLTKGAMGGVFGDTLWKLSGSGIAATASYAPMVSGSFYMDLIENGVDPGKAADLTVWQTLTNSALEAGPMSEWISPSALVGKKGVQSIFQRSTQMALQEGLFEEGSQQLAENALRRIGYKRSDSFIRDLFEGYGESVLVGTAMGGMYANSPARLAKGSFDFLNSRLYEVQKKHNISETKMDQVRDIMAKFFKINTSIAAKVGVDIVSTIAENNKEAFESATEVFGENQGKIALAGRPYNLLEPPQKDEDKDKDYYKKVGEAQTKVREATKEAFNGLKFPAKVSVINGPPKQVTEVPLHPSKTFGVNKTIMVKVQNQRLVKNPTTGEITKLYKIDEKDLASTSNIIGKFKHPKVVTTDSMDTEGTWMPAKLLGKPTNTEKVRVTSVNKWDDLPIVAQNILLDEVAPLWGQGKKDSELQASAAVLIKRFVKSSVNKVVIDSAVDINDPIGYSLFSFYHLQKVSLDSFAASMVNRGIQMKNVTVYRFKHRLQKEGQSKITYSELNDAYSRALSDPATVRGKVKELKVNEVNEQIDDYLSTVDEIMSLQDQVKNTDNKKKKKDLRKQIKSLKADLKISGESLKVIGIDMASLTPKEKADAIKLRLKGKQKANRVIENKIDSFFKAKADLYVIKKRLRSNQTKVKDKYVDLPNVNKDVLEKLKNAFKQKTREVNRLRNFFKKKGMPEPTPEESRVVPGYKGLPDRLVKTIKKLEVNEVNEQIDDYLRTVNKIMSLQDKVKNTNNKKKKGALERQINFLKVDLKILGESLKVTGIDITSLTSKEIANAIKLRLRRKKSSKINYKGLPDRLIEAIKKVEAKEAEAKEVKDPAAAFVSPEKMRDLKAREQAEKDVLKQERLAELFEESRELQDYLEEIVSLEAKGTAITDAEYERLTDLEYEVERIVTNDAKPSTVGDITELEELLENERGIKIIEGLTVLANGKDKMRVEGIDREHNMIAFSTTDRNVFTQEYSEILKLLNAGAMREVQVTGGKGFINVPATAPTMAEKQIKTKSLSRLQEWWAAKRRAGVYRLDTGAFLNSKMMRMSHKGVFRDYISNIKEKIVDFINMYKSMDLELLKAVEQSKKTNIAENFKQIKYDEEKGKYVNVVEKGGSGKVNLINSLKNDMSMAIQESNRIKKEELGYISRWNKKTNRESLQRPFHYTKPSNYQELMNRLNKLYAVTQHLALRIKAVEATSETQLEAMVITERRGKLREIQEQIEKTRSHIDKELIAFLRSKGVLRVLSLINADSTRAIRSSAYLQQVSDMLTQKLSDLDDEILDIARENKTSDDINGEEGLFQGEEEEEGEGVVQERQEEIPRIRPASLEINYEEDVSTGDVRRTDINTKADATLAFAINFNSVRGILTKKKVKQNGKMYIPIDLSDVVRTGAGTIYVDRSAMRVIADKMIAANVKTINITGNELSALAGKFSQEELDQYINLAFGYIQERFLEQGKYIESVRSGGQTGADEAGIKAARHLRIKTTILAPKGWRFRNADGQDISDEKKFKARFELQSTQQLKPTPESTQMQINYEEDVSAGYARRTDINAKADATLAFAIDFSSPGEILTRKKVKQNGKMYIPIDLSFSASVDRSAMRVIADKMIAADVKTINIAGNGLFTLVGKFSQEELDQYISLAFECIQERFLEQGKSIESVRSGGQTGADEAGIKAARRLGIKTTILAPKGWRFRNADGQDISDEKKFKARFEPQSTQQSTQLSIVGLNEDYDVKGMRGPQGQTMATVQPASYGQKDSGWLGNPYKANDIRGGKGNVSREEAIRLFEAAFLQKIKNDPEYKAAVENLRGKKLGYYQPGLPNHLQAVERYLQQHGPQGQTMAQQDATDPISKETIAKTEKDVQAEVDQTPTGFLLDVDLKVKKTKQPITSSTTGEPISARVDVDSKTIYVDEKQQRKSHKRFMKGGGLWTPQWVKLGVIDIPLSMGLTLAERKRFTIEHEKAHVLSKIGAGKQSATAENLINIIAFERIGRTDIANHIRSEIKVSERVLAELQPYFAPITADPVALQQEIEDQVADFTEMEKVEMDEWAMDRKVHTLAEDRMITGKVVNGKSATGYDIEGIKEGEYYVVKGDGILSLVTWGAIEQEGTTQLNYLTAEAPTVVYDTGAVPQTLLPGMFYTLTFSSEGIKVKNSTLRGYGVDQSFNITYEEFFASLMSGNLKAKIKLAPTEEPSGDPTPTGSEDARNEKGVTESQDRYKTTMSTLGTIITTFAKIIDGKTLAKHLKVSLSSLTSITQETIAPTKEAGKELFKKKEDVRFSSNADEIHDNLTGVVFLNEAIDEIAVVAQAEMDLKIISLLRGHIGSKAVSVWLNQPTNKKWRDHHSIAKQTGKWWQSLRGAEKAVRKQIDVEARNTVLKFVRELMGLSQEEWKATQVGGQTMAALSDLGIKRSWTIKTVKPSSKELPNQQQIDNMFEYERIVGALTAYGLINEQWYEQQLLDIKKFRPGEMFTSALKHIEPQLLDLILLRKAQVEGPIFMESLKAGAYPNLDIASKMQRGYGNRHWVKKGSQDKGGIDGYGKTTNPAQEYETQAEFARGSLRQGITPYLDWSIGSSTYFSKTLKKTVMMNSVNNLYTFMRHSKTNMPLVMWKNSEELLKEVESREKNGKKVEPDGLLKDMGYVKFPEGSGMVKWSRGTQLYPYVHESLLPTLKYLYQGTGDFGEVFNRIMTIQNVLKWYMTVNPVDSPLRFSASAISVMPFKKVWSSPLAKQIAFNSPLATMVKFSPKFPFVAPGDFFTGSKKARKQMLEGEYIGNREIMHDKNFHLAVMGGVVFNLPQVFKSMFESDAFKTLYSHEQTFGDRYRDVLSSAFGTMAHVFDNYAGKVQMMTFNVLLERFQNQGFSETRAAVKAGNAVNQLVNLFRSRQFGSKAHAKVWNMSCFTRNLVASPLRMIGSTLYPFWAGMTNKELRVDIPKNKLTDLFKIGGKTFATKWYGKTGAAGLNTGATSGLLNIVKSGERMSSEMEDEWQMWLGFLGRLIGLKIALLGAIQFGLSFLDDDEWDEHGEKNQPLAKKRFMFNNEPAKRMMIRMPFKDVNQRRLYIDPQLWKEVNDIFDVFIGSFSKKWGRGAGEWARSKKHLMITMMAEIGTGRDSFTGEEIAPKALQSSEEFHKYYSAYIGKYLKEYAVPLGVRKEEFAQLGHSLPIEVAFDLAQLFGASIKKGIGVEEGMLASDAYLARDELAFKRWKQDEVTRVGKGLKSFNAMSVVERMNRLNEFYTTTSLTRGEIKRQAPVRDMLITQGALRAKVNRESYYEDPAKKLFKRR